MKTQLIPYQIYLMSLKMQRMSQSMGPNIEVMLTDFTSDIPARNEDSNGFVVVNVTRGGNRTGT